MRSSGVVLALLLLGVLPAAAHATPVFGPARPISDAAAWNPAVAVGVNGDVAVAWRDERRKAIVVHIRRRRP